MSKEAWDEVRRHVGQAKAEPLVLGDLYSYIVRATPRHLLFTLSRYKFITRLLCNDEPKKVLELGCGEGLSTVLIAEDGHEITAVDFDERAISYANEHIKKAGIEFKCDDFTGKLYGSFDAVVSLDVIEHINEDREDEFMATICSNLQPHGFTVIGTPNITASAYASENSKIGHINLYSAQRLTSLVRKYFWNVFIFGMNDEVVHTGFYPMCHYLFAVGCGKKG
ncbi:MAG: class I SAM-dependent methyltransferase [Nitrospirae bacterium]|nr:class I SAM-dependent methyltransferase [Nitrospirota bacterium]